MVIIMKYQFSTEQRAEIEAARKANHDKQIEKRLRVLSLRGEGIGLIEIAERTGFHRSHISNLIRKYFEEGLSSIAEKHYHGNRRNMSFEDETSFLEQYEQQAEHGNMVDIREIKDAYEKEVGHNISSGQIYRVLSRHGWRKIMPRSKHPKKANNEVIETSKKLTQESKN